MANEKRLIDANEVKKQIWYGNSDPSNMRQYASGFIDNAPTVDAMEVVHGRWIKDGDVVVCSNCGEEHAWDEYRATYCDNCGEKMDGGKGND